MSYDTILLNREPFSTSPDPSFLYRSLEHYAALNRLEITIRLKRGLSLILGDVGTGKTTLSRALLQSFSGEEDRYLFYMILDPAFKSEHQFLSHLSKLFNGNPFFNSSVDHRESIENFLYQKCVEEGKTVVLMIDEGQKLNDSQLEILRTLLNYETNERKLLQLVIFGQLELVPRVIHVKNFMDRVNLKYILNPLDRYETGELIKFRLKKAGYENSDYLFSQDAIHAIYDYTQGYPRQITKVCHKAMQSLITDQADKITGQLIEQIIVLDKIWK